ncbi:hypothetical protein [Cupriavidus sp. UME77]|nr:hypothetical protein [Cupriavidus sp. UME77]
MDGLSNGEQRKAGMPGEAANGKWENNHDGNQENIGRLMYSIEYD